MNRWDKEGGAAADWLVGVWDGWPSRGVEQWLAHLVDEEGFGGLAHALNVRMKDYTHAVQPERVRCRQCHATRANALDRNAPFRPLGVPRGVLGGGERGGAIVVCASGSAGQPMNNDRHGTLYM